MHLGNANLWRFFCGRMFCMLFTQWPTFSSSKLVSELHKKSYVTLGCEEDKIWFLALLENSASRGCWILRSDWSTETGRSLIPPTTARWTQNEKNNWRFVVSLLSPSLSLSFSVFLTLIILRNSSKHPLHHTHVQRCTDWRDTDSKHRGTERQADTVCACVCVCVCARRRNRLCSVHMSVRDGQRLGVSGSVSGRVKFLIYTVVCRLSYRVWYLAGLHVEDRWGHYSQVDAIEPPKIAEYMSEEKWKFKKWWYNKCMQISKM
jgi:hypothetical protein